MSAARKYPARIWQFKTTVLPPAWVAGDFADAGHKLIHRSGYSVNEGDWIVNFKKGMVMIVTEQDFGTLKDLILEVA